MSKINDMVEAGDLYYTQSLAAKSTEQCTAAAVLAAGRYWCAFVLGHPQAAFPLALCFTEGRGVKKDVHIGKLFFGVAKLLGDDRCAYDAITVPENMYGEVKSLFDAFKKAHETFSPQMESNAEIEISTINSQFRHFSNYFYVDQGSIMDHFINHGETNPTQDVALAGADDNSDCCGCTIL